MRLAVLAVAASLVAPAASAAPPKAGVLDPGGMLGGVRLGDTRGQVRAAWGSRFGVCRGCPDQTWYFNLRPFEPEGAAVTFRRGRVVAVFTVWAPPGWRTTAGLVIGAPAGRVTALHPGFMRQTCGTYFAYTFPAAAALTAIYVHDEKVWGFGLQRRALSACR